MKKKIILKEGNNNNIPFPSKQEIESGAGMPILYRVAFSDQINSIFATGYSRDFTGSKGGNMYGPGVYCTFGLADTINNLSKEYGNTIVQMRLIGGFQKFLIFDRKLAQQIYKDKWKIEDQLLSFGFSERSIIKYIDVCKRTHDFHSFYDHRTAPAALILWKNVNIDLFLKHGVRGIVYKGNRDGFCVLPYDFNSLVPYAVSYDRGKTFKKRFDTKLYNYMSNYTDNIFKFGGAYKKVYKSVNGFTLIQNDEDKFNYIHHRTNRLISDIWFDNIDSTINANTGVFGFTVSNYHFYATINVPKDTTDLAIILDSNNPDGDLYCGISLLGDLIKEMKNNKVIDIEQFIEMTDSENNNSTVNEKLDYLIHKQVKRIINECTRKLIYEDRTVDENGVVTVDNFDKIKEILIKPEHEDDVWFVPIIQRHKDNPHLYFERDACNYITSYYIHNVDELCEKEAEIKAVCHATNSRAYIHINKRSMIEISDYANNVLKPRFKKYNQKHYMGHELEVAAGQAKDWDKRKLCFLDIDSDDENVHQKVLQLLQQHNITPLWEYRSMNNGWHILLPDKEEAKKIDFSVIDNGQDYGRYATVGLEIDKRILLYARLKPNGYGAQQQVQKKKSNKLP